MGVGAVLGRPAERAERAQMPTPTQLVNRLRRLRLTQKEVAERLEVSEATMGWLLHGKATTCARLGYDQWPTYVASLLDGYEVALPLLQERAKAIAAEFEERGLPIPAQLAACLPAERRGRRKGGK